MRTFSLKFSKMLRTCQENTRGSEKNNLFFTAFTFLNRENLNSMSYSGIREHVNFVLLTHSHCV